MARKRSSTRRKSGTRKRSNKKFIQKAIKKPGALRKTAGVKKGQKIPEAKLRALAKKPGKTGQRARFALTLRKMNRKRRKR